MLGSLVSHMTSCLHMHLLKSPDEDVSCVNVASDFNDGSDVIDVNDVNDVNDATDVDDATDDDGDDHSSSTQPAVSKCCLFVVLIVLFSCRSFLVMFCFRLNLLNKL